MEDKMLRQAEQVPSVSSASNGSTMENKKKDWDLKKNGIFVLAAQLSYLPSD